MPVADGAWLWYWAIMTRKRRSITTSPEIIETIAERTKMIFDLQTTLIPWLAANEKAQRNGFTVL